MKFSLSIILTLFPFLLLQGLSIPVASEEAAICVGLSRVDIARRNIVSKIRRYADMSCF